MLTDGVKISSVGNGERCSWIFNLEIWYPDFNASAPACQNWWNPLFLLSFWYVESMEKSHSAGDSLCIRSSYSQAVPSFIDRDFSTLTTYPAATGLSFFLQAVLIRLGGNTNVHKLPSKWVGVISTACSTFFFIQVQIYACVCLPSACLYLRECSPVSALCNSLPDRNAPHVFPGGLPP